MHLASAACMAPGTLADDGSVPGCRYGAQLPWSPFDIFFRAYDIEFYYGHIERGEAMRNLKDVVKLATEDGYKYV